jgi:hypothetical protein
MGSRFTDIAGNNNTASNALSLAVDNIAPTILITTNTTNVNQTTSAILTFGLSEASLNFTVEDISVSGGSLSGFTGSGARYTANFVASTNSTTSASISVMGSRFTDIAGNNNTASNALSLAVDILPAPVTVESCRVSNSIPNGVVNNNTVVHYVFSFSRSIVGLPSSAFSVTNGVIESIPWGHTAGVGFDVYVRVNAGVSGPLSITLLNNGVTAIDGGRGVGYTSAPSFVIASASTKSATQNNELIANNVGGLDKGGVAVSTPTQQNTSDQGLDIASLVNSDANGADLYGAISSVGIDSLVESMAGFSLNNGLSTSASTIFSAVNASYINLNTNVF